MMKYLHILILSTIGSAALLLLSGCEKAPEKPGFTIKVDSEPQGATVSYRNKERGKTPYSTVARRTGTFVFKISMNGYEPQWLPLVVSESGASAKVQLKPITADILITSSPSEAQVKINDVVMGETPLVLKNQPVGEQTAVIEKTGFVSRRESWTVKDSRPLKISADLSSNIGVIKLTSNPDQAEVFIDGKYYGLTPLEKKVEQGKLKVVVKKEGYSTFDEYIITQRNQTVSREIHLHLLPGSLNVSSVPQGAAIYVNNSLSDKKTPALLENLAPGNYSIKIEKGGFSPVTKEIKITRGGKSSLHFELGVNTGGIDLVANPPGVTVYLNGKEHGQTEADEDGKFSKVYRLRGLSEGIQQITVAHKRAQPPQKTINVNITKGKITRTAPVNLWIANAELKLKSGRKMIGLLKSETENEVFFEPEPGVRQAFKRSEIEYLEPLQNEE
jgi:hypothetical protein